MSDYVKAWQCIGCGTIEAPQTCIGVCDYRKVQFVYANEHEQALEASRAARGALEQLVRRLAFTQPRDGEWESSYRALQQQARELLAGLAVERGR
jgi:hypothetical protein